MDHAQNKNILFGRGNKGRLLALRNFLSYQNIICFDWVMNLSYLELCFLSKKCHFQQLWLTFTQNLWLASRLLLYIDILYISQLVLAVKLGWWQKIGPLWATASLVYSFLLAIVVVYLFLTFFDISKSFVLNLLLLKVF